MSKEEEFYVYLFSDVDGTPVYVGKGTGSRASSHLRPSGRRSSNERLQRFMSKRAGNGFSLEPQIIASGSEENMLMVEVALIKHFGRADKGLGTLFNNTEKLYAFALDGNLVSSPFKEFVLG